MSDHLSVGRHVFQTEVAALNNICGSLDENFNRAVESILACEGTVVVCGLGKSGHIGKKISATLASTGTRSISLHPSEALHGDLGRIGPDDLILGISYSGETDELLQVIAYAKALDVPVIGITGFSSSTLAKNADISIITFVAEEACSELQAPTSSTTAALVVGDALAVALMKARNFKAEDFARLHPGGTLGKLLLTKVRDYMVEAVSIHESASFRDVIIKISSGNGLLVVFRECDEIGVITDGDVRRRMKSLPLIELEALTAKDLMSTDPKMIDAEASCIQADRIMRERGINSLVVEVNDSFYVYNRLNRR